MVKADYLYSDNENIYALLKTMVVVYDKSLVKKIALKLTNPICAISNRTLNRLIVLTSKPEVYVYSLGDYELLYKEALSGTTLNYYYDNNEDILYITSIGLGKTYLYRFDLKNLVINANNIDEEIKLEPFKVVYDDVLFLGYKITKNPIKDYKVYEYVKTTLDFVTSKTIDYKENGLRILDEYLTYTPTDGLVNLKSGEVIPYKSLGINDRIVVNAKKVSDYYFINCSNNSYILDKSLKMIKEESSSVLAPIVDAAILDDNIYYSINGNVKIVKM